MQRKVLAASLGVILPPLLLMPTLEIVAEYVGLSTTPGLVSSFFMTSLVLSTLGGMAGYEMTKESSPFSRISRKDKASELAFASFTSNTRSHSKKLNKNHHNRLQVQSKPPLLPSGGPFKASIPSYVKTYSTPKLPSQSATRDRSQRPK